MERDKFCSWRKKKQLFVIYFLLEFSWIFLDSRVYSILFLMEFGDHYFKYLQMLTFIFWQTVTLIISFFIASINYEKSPSQVSSVPELFLHAYNFPFYHIALFCWDIQNYLLFPTLTLILFLGFTKAVKYLISHKSYNDSYNIFFLF